jgi:hypothetical protein
VARRAKKGSSAVRADGEQRGEVAFADFLSAHLGFER